MVVVGNAISRGNVELETVLERRQRYCSLPERIRDEFLWDRDPIVVSGTHGKTTTTSMVAWVLTHAGLDPSLLVGGIAGNFDASYRLGAGRDFVIEGDEYDSAFFDKTAKFLKYVPDTVIVNNVEFDHADIYPDVDGDPDRVHALLRLVPATGRVFIGADDAGAARWLERPSASSRRSACRTARTGRRAISWPDRTGRRSRVARAGEVLGQATRADDRAAQRPQRPGGHCGGRLARRGVRL